ncbi:sporulation histidine kinase inhibitor Sda [Rubeoparvulum massiliense]|nr:sporulation histidine kinase inhibitor Sda [Rubeoparvulum massiliense]
MTVISDQSLIEAYFKAVELQLDLEFIHLLYREIERRNLTLQEAIGE